MSPTCTSGGGRPTGGTWEFRTLLGIAAFLICCYAMGVCILEFGLAAGRPGRGLPVHVYAQRDVALSAEAFLLLAFIMTAIHAVVLFSIRRRTARFAIRSVVLRSAIAGVCSALAVWGINALLTAGALSVGRAWGLVLLLFGGAVVAITFVAYRTRFPGAETFG